MTEKKEPARCAESVYKSDGNWGRSHQCSRKAGFGPDGKYCRQHAQRYIRVEPTATWYKTDNWSFKIETVAVISETDKRLLIKPDWQDRPRTENKHSEHSHYWPSRDKAVAALGERLEAKRAALAKDEAEFLRVSAGK